MTANSISVLSRRRFVQLVGLSTLGGLAATRAAKAGGHAKVNPEDPQPKALGYVEDAATVDKESFSQYAEGSMCSSCNLYSGADGKAYGPCGIFPGQEVSANGWCSAYQPKS